MLAHKDAIALEEAAKAVLLCTQHLASGTLLPDDKCRWELSLRGQIKYLRKVAFEAGLGADI